VTEFFEYEDDDYYSGLRGLKTIDVVITSATAFLSFVPLILGFGRANGLEGYN